MSDKDFVITTQDEARKLSKLKEVVIEPLTLYNEDIPLLKEVMPEYTNPIPNDDMTILTQRMRMTMKKYGGIGLSANQCGVRARVFVIGTDQFQIVCINPKIISKSDEMERDREGCLSAPGLFLPVSRHTSIKTEFTDENGETKQVEFFGLTARCFQHELDHLNGIFYTSLASKVSLDMARRRQKKVLRKYMKGQNVL